MPCSADHHSSTLLSDNDEYGKIMPQAPNIDLIHNAIMQHLPESEDFTPRDRTEASKLIQAALLSLIGFDSHPSE